MFIADFLGRRKTNRTYQERNLAMIDQKTSTERLEQACDLDDTAAALHAACNKTRILRRSRGARITLCAFMVCIVVACLCIESVYADDTNTDQDPTKAGDSVQNTGQDPTNPVTRLDIRLQNDELPYDSNFNNNDSDTLILRADAPIPLGTKSNPLGILAFRMDIAMSSVRTNVPGETGSYELGSTYLQFLHIVPPSWGNLPKSSAWAWGYAAQMPTATNGRQERTDIILFGAKWDMKIGSNPKVRNGSYTTPVLKYYYGPGETDRGFDKINGLHLQPVINFGIPAGIDFITLWGNFDWIVTFEDGVARPQQKSGDYFIPWDITFGKMLSGGKVVVSATFAGDLFSSEGFEQFDERFLIRIGFFF